MKSNVVTRQGFLSLKVPSAFECGPHDKDSRAQTKHNPNLNNIKRPVSDHNPHKLKTMDSLIGVSGFDIGNETKIIQEEILSRELHT